MKSKPDSHHIKFRPNLTHSKKKPTQRRGVPKAITLSQTNVNETAGLELAQITFGHTFHLAQNG